jgi:hypothetical protein
MLTYADVWIESSLLCPHTAIHLAASYACRYTSSGLIHQAVSYSYSSIWVLIGGEDGAAVPPAAAALESQVLPAAAALESQVLPAQG